MRRNQKNDKEQARIFWAIKEKIMHFSPTISPAPKNIERAEIESIYEALLHFKNEGVQEVVVQPKYMGSYCDIYLSKDINDTKFTSREGHLIDYLDRNALLEAVKPIHTRFDFTDLELVIVQAELMPWAAMGKKLIERDFLSYYNACLSHAQELKKSSITHKLETLSKSKEFSEFLLKSAEGDISEFKPHEISAYKALDKIVTESLVPNPSFMLGQLEKYKEQLDIYGKEATIHFKPFNVLKKVYLNGTQHLQTSNAFGFYEVSDDAFLVVSLADKNFEDSVEYTKQFFDGLVAKNMEGIMIKPEQIDVEKTPCLKVRNTNYLRMIYGWDFAYKYLYHLDRRNIGKKLKISKNEVKISNEILKIHPKDITESNERYVSLVTSRIKEEEFEEELDTRL
jgi:hypothetical protein